MKLFKSNKKHIIDRAQQSQKRKGAIINAMVISIVFFIAVLLVSVIV
ncbi:hypothetical protein NYQ10_20715 [Flavobacterium johnsoniae]|uniref:Uncharacterized protein n=2 Tax=Flavobacterium TaxID=237 RepID=A0A7W7N7X8_9FLAO|nr:MULTISPECIES: hypothetical protein [Flavobacterium]MBB4801782.1 hypothetical protein [Flavobacterium nitrogenifigens]MBB6386740.1 hypothetical protein [Flavobacterium notoginsengisoli]WDF58121.1 hypothetical protein PQ462_15500 [Flavobacterium sp. KACC 22758]WET03378.1 hypothetical protein P0R33_03370 [Flavobacterium sp. YJ01]WET04021.1 hypothetical protein P0R33_06685 [Flavobacterium sp. YJ01]